MLSAVLALFSLGPLSGQGQNSGPSAAEIDQWLNSVDSSSSWGKTPAAGGAATQAPAQWLQPGGQSLPQGQSGWTQPGNMQMQPRSGWPAERNFGSMFGRPNTAAGAGRQGFPGTMGAVPGQSPFGRLTKQDILRIFLGGSSSGSSSQNPQKYYDASSNRQVALDQASQAESAAARASYGTNRDAKLSAAAEARNHANAARAAADRATSAAYGGSNEAQDAAAQARDAANRAEYAANQADANAHGGGW